ncbi:MAG: TonB-dependent receptor, partial [Oxalobacteraceae bacterium]
NPVNDPSATVSLPGRAGGNRNLLEETAKTWTVGVVLQPRFLPRLTITADWFNVKLKNAVRTASAQELVDLCVDQPSLDNVYCANVTRSGTTGYVSDYFLAPQNVAAFRTSGLDLSLTYTLDVSPEVGAFSLRVNGNYLDKLTFVPTPGAEVEDSRLLPSAPKYSGQADLTWTNGPLTLNYGLTYQSKTRRFTVDQITANPNYADPQYFFYRERWEHDIQASVRAGDRFSFYGGVNNLSGKIGDVGNRTGIGTPYNVLGRVFYAGARMSLDKLF